MKPFKECPACAAHFTQDNKNAIWWEEFCSNMFNGVNPCPIKFRQYYKSSFQDDQLRYLQFYTKNFHIYVYFEPDTLWPGKTYIYDKVFNRGEHVQGPAFIVNNFPIDFNDLEKIDFKFRKLNLFK